MTSEHVMQQAQELATTIEAETLQMQRTNAVIINAAQSSSRSARAAEERKGDDQRINTPRS